MIIKKDFINLAEIWSEVIYTLDIDYIGYDPYPVFQIQENFKNLLRAKYPKMDLAKWNKFIDLKLKEFEEDKKRVKEFRESKEK